MNLDNRENYLKERALLFNLPLLKLKKYVAEMHKIRYDDNDIEVEAEYRLASFVLTRRTRSGSSLIFHMKNFIGLLVGWILFSKLVI